MGKKAKLVPFWKLRGKVLKKIEKDDSSIHFYTQDNCHYLMCHEYSGEDSAWIADICGDLNDLIGQTIVVVEMVDSSGWKGEDYGDRWVFYIIATNKDTITIRWNGYDSDYYSVEVDFFEYIEDMEE